MELEQHCAPASKPVRIQQGGWKVPAMRAYKGNGGKPGLPPEFWGAIDYTPKVSLQKKIRKVLKDDGDPTPDTAMRVVDKVLASIKPADRDEALRTALLICVLQVLHPPRGRPGGQPKAW